MNYIKLIGVVKSYREISIRILKDNIIDFLRERIEYETESEFIEYYTESYMLVRDLVKNKEEILTDFYIFLDNDYIKDLTILKMKILESLEDLEEEKSMKIRYVNEIISKGNFNPFLEANKDKIIEDYVVYNAIR